MNQTFCPRCGTTMELRFVEGRNREVCPACQHILYRNPVPAVGVVVTLDQRVVLVQRKYDPQAGYWALPAGYMELGESAEEAAIRECLEETGLHIQINNLLGVYSYGGGGFSGIVIIYAATAIGGILEAHDDAEEVGVFSLDELPTPMAFRTHMQAIERWRQRERLVLGADTLIRPELGILVRYAHRDDEERIIGMLTLLPPYTNLTDEQLLTASALFHDRLHDPDHPFLVVEVDGIVAGFAALTFRRTLTGWRAAIDDLAVDPTQRRRGLGQALVEAAVRVAYTRNCSVLHIDTAMGSDEARAFYRACGFADGLVATITVG